jgi:hypothetical protein
MKNSYAGRKIVKKQIYTYLLLDRAYVSSGCDSCRLPLGLSLLVSVCSNLVRTDLSMWERVLSLKAGQVPRSETQAIFKIKNKEIDSIGKSD